jgi:hypothetical protein
MIAYPFTQAIVELAADSRQVSSCYSGLCAAIPNAEDGVSSANPMGFTVQKQPSVLPSRYHYQTTLFE